jgi:hypothetical protein
MKDNSIKIKFPPFLKINLREIKFLKIKIKCKEKKLVLI